MKLYHMSDTLHLGDKLKSDFKRQMELAQPFVQALQRGEDCFYAMYFNAKYLRAVLGKFKLRDMWSDYVKWSVEGIFEYVRRTEFPQCCSRLKCNYYFATIEEARTLYEIDWGKASDEERMRIRLFEIELEADEVDRRDMRLFDEAYDAVWDHEADEAYDAIWMHGELQEAMNCVRRYFAGEQSAEPIWELMSDRPATAEKDLTAYLRKE